MKTSSHSSLRFNVCSPKPLFIPVSAVVLLLCLFAVIAPSKLRAQGTLTNGWLHTGTISPVGDSDSWTFTASSGDTIVIRVGEISQVNSFTPRIRLQNP